jgi:hypothetical protein
LILDGSRVVVVLYLLTLKMLHEKEDKQDLAGTILEVMLNPA